MPGRLCQKTGRRLRGGALEIREALKATTIERRGIVSSANGMALMSQPPDFPELYDVRFMYEAAADALRCEPDISVWEWAAQNREWRGPGAAEPGPYRTERTPFLREIQESLSPSSPYQTIIFMKGSQVGGSE